MKRFILLCAFLTVFGLHVVWAAEQFVVFSSRPGSIALTTDDTQPLIIAADEADYKGISIALQSLLSDIGKVTGCQAEVRPEMQTGTRIIAGSVDRSRLIRQLVKEKKIDGKALKGKVEKYLITMLHNPLGIEGDVLVIAGSDKRGTIYGIYEFSRQLGVSPWNWWADVPVVHRDEVYILPGVYTDGEPTVRYRGLFLNDEAPCLSGWVKEKFPDKDCPSAKPSARGFNHHFYARVFELLLRLRANYLWPAMWSNAFYDDDPLNMVTADEMGIIMGTSHHEPMARNHQEWARHRKEYGAWDYASNQEVIDRFFREGIERCKDTEDLITIGMRGDGDAPMGGKEGEDDKYVSRDEYNKRLLERIIANQRRIIKEVTGRPAEKRQQVWAIYKEVQRFYDMGLQVPDDVLILLCDDNWGNIRRVPQFKDRNRKGGWGMYYHVDYVGAPRSSKWTNITPIAHLWDQMDLAYEYGIDRLWILNVGDLKPMEYPIQLFLDMAWRPSDFTAGNFRRHAVDFCRSCFGDAQAQEAARILETYSIYNGRVTPEMLNPKTYNMANGEFRAVAQDYKALEADALRQYLTLPQEYRDAYYQLILFPVQAMANLYEMYYAVAMNHKLYGENNPQANEWADKAEVCFARDRWLNNQYNHELAGGKWNHLMDEVHIGYTSWSGPKENIMPEVYRIDASGIQRPGGYSFTARNGFVAMEAEHYYSASDAAAAHWTIVPTLGRTLSGVELLPRAASLDGASLTYRMRIPSGVAAVKVHVVTNSTLPYQRTEGHRYTLSMDGGTAKEINYNGRYNEDNQWEMYDIVATRVIETITELPLGPADAEGYHTLTISPLDAGLVLEKIVVDCGGYEKSHLFGTESPCSR